jgi:hypothetical protein
VTELSRLPEWLALLIDILEKFDSNFGVKYFVVFLTPSRQYVSPKRWCPPASLHGVTTQKTNIHICTAVRT